MSDMTESERLVILADTIARRDAWAERGRPGLAEWHNAQAIALDDIGRRRQTDTAVLERLWHDLPDPGVAEIVPD